MKKSTTSTAKTLKTTTQRKVPVHKEIDREKLNRGNLKKGNPKRHDGQSDNGKSSRHKD